MSLNPAPDNKRTGMLQFERPRLYDFDERGVASKRPSKAGPANAQAQILKDAIAEADHVTHL